MTMPETTQSDLVERLRDATPPHYGKCVAAANEIERLRRENRLMREALAACQKESTHD